MSHLNVIGEFYFGVSGVATTATALTLRPPENFNLAINGQIRQIAKFKLPPNFPYIDEGRHVVLFQGITTHFYQGGKKPYPIRLKMP